MGLYRPLRKFGTSLGVSIPKAECEGRGLEEGDIVEIEVKLARKKGKEPANPDKVAKEQPAPPKEEEIPKDS